MHIKKVISCFLLGAPAISVALSLRLVTFNIRGGTPAKLSYNEQPWSTRRPLLMNQVSHTVNSAPKEALTIIAMQEIPDAVLNEVETDLGPEWKHIGVGRDDGKKEGEYAPILYKESDIKVLFTETKWLSPTPDVPSKGWNARTKRIVTIGVFERKACGSKLIVANTHLDHVSEEARIEGVKVILARIKLLQQRWGPLPVSVTGDFNSEAGQVAYGEMVGAGYKDSFNMTAEAKRFGPFATSVTPHIFD